MVRVSWWCGGKKRLPQKASCSNLFCNTGIFHKIAPEWDAAKERTTSVTTQGVKFVIDVSRARPAKQVL